MKILYSSNKLEKKEKKEKLRPDRLVIVKKIVRNNKFKYFKCVG